MSYYLGVLKKYAVFEGRASRKEYWMFVLFNIIISLAISSLFGLMKVPALACIYSLAILVPSIAVTVRRLHDIGKAGTWYFIVFVPIIGGIWLIVLLATAGTTGSNQYGDDPYANGNTY